MDPPEGFRTDSYLVRPLFVSDAELDHEALMASKDILRLWEQSTWPEDDFSVDANRRDIERMAAAQRRGERFTYTVLTPDEGRCLGCIYVMAPEMKWLRSAEPVTVDGTDWVDVDATVSFWIRASELGRGFDRTVLEEMWAWIERDWPFARPVVIANETFAQQVETISSAGLRHRLDFRLPGEPGTYHAWS